MRTFFEKNHICQTAAAVARQLRQSGRRAFFVGGAVRDILLGKPPKDIDIVTSATPEETIELFPDNEQVGAAFGIVIVKINGFCFEVATFREERNYLDGRRPSEVKYTDDPATDAARRDFTINGMFYDPETGKILDFVGGMADLDAGIVRVIGDAKTRFEEDYLRMLRAVRFAARFGFELEKATATAIRELADNVSLLAPERITGELNLMLTGPRPDEAVRLLESTGLLEQILPEVAVMRGVAQPKQFHPEGDVYCHTLLMLEHMVTPSVELAWSILLHDVGKPSTFSVDKSGIEHFYGHEEEGASMAVEILGRLRFSAAATTAIRLAIRNHMRFAHVKMMRPAKWKRLLADDNFPLELELHRIDCIASHGLMDCFIWLLDRLNELAGQPELPRPLISGKDLIALGLKPGPLFGEILEKCMDSQLAGEITTKEEAIACIKKEKFN